MTLLVVLMLGGGVVLIISAIECVSILQTAKDVWNGDVAGYTWQCGGNASSGAKKAIGNAIRGGATAPFIPPLGPSVLPGGAGPGASGGADLYGWEGWSSWHTRF